METVTITITKTEIMEVEMDIVLFRKIICRRKKDEEEDAYLKRSQEAFEDLCDKTSGEISIEHEVDNYDDEETIIKEYKEDIKEHM